MAFESNSENSATSDDRYNIYDMDSEPDDIYGSGGYMKLPDSSMIASRYEIIQKLGWGHAGMVYLCRDQQTQTYCAIKIYRSHKYYRMEYKDEIRITEKLMEFPDNNYSVKVLEHFEINGKGGEGHKCAVLELLGVSIYEIMKYTKFRGFPLQFCKFVTREVVKILDYFHSTCGIIVCDIRPKNILLQLTTAQVNSLEEKGLIEEKLDSSVFKHTDTPYKVLNSAFSCNFPVDSGKKQKVAKSKGKKKSGSAQDRLKQLSKLGLVNEEFRMKLINLGSASEMPENCTREVPTLNYRSPEVILKMPYTAATDIWSLGCLVFELATGNNLFEPLKNTGYRKEDDHLAQMVEALGELPKDFTAKSLVYDKYFNEKGRLKNIFMLRHWPLRDVLIERHGIIPEEAEALDEFLRFLLCYDPEKRPNLQEIAQHPWLHRKSRDETWVGKERMKALKEIMRDRESEYWKKYLNTEESVFRA